MVNNALRYVLFSEDSTLQFVRDEINRLGAAVDRGDESGQLLANAPRVLQMAVAYDWLYDALSTADRATIRDHISGNYCRCTGYQAIVDAVETVAKARQTAGERA